MDGRVTLLLALGAMAAWPVPPIRRWYADRLLGVAGDWQRDAAETIETWPAETFGAHAAWLSMACATLLASIAWDMLEPER